MDYVTDGDMEDSDAELPLAHRAATNGDTKNLMSAIKADPTVLEQQDGEGLSPLSHATMAEQLDSLKLLVKMGASINAQDNLGRTCLSMAAYQGWYDGVVFLLRNGARDSICDKAGRSPLHSATYDVDTKVLTALLHNMTPDETSQQDNEGMAALHWTCFHNRPQHTKFLLEKGANVFSHDIDGKTPLHWAAQKGSASCTEQLLQGPQGAALVNTTDFSGKSPLHFAAAAGHTAVIRELSAYHPIDIDCQDPDERTPLHWAAAMGQTDAVTSLLELNANPNPVDLEQGTPLDYARQSGHDDCVQILEERLGMRNTNGPVETSGGRGANQNVSPPKTRKGPLGFIVDLFKTKKNKPTTTIETSDEMCNETSTGSGDSNANHNIRSSANQRLSTPKKLREPEMLISMEKLQVSREDNPVASSRGSGNGKKDAAYELGEIQPSHSQNVPLGAAGRSVLPPSGAKTNLDHSHLIRSPPPTLKRAGSPVGGVWNTEKDHGKLEEDAAAILALQRSADLRPTTGTSTLTASKSLSPITKGADANFYTKRAQTTTPSGGGCYTSISPGADSVSSSRSQPAQLGPLKGPVPPSPTPRLAATNSAVKRLDGLRPEPPPTNRTPSPPPSIPHLTATTTAPGDNPARTSTSRNRSNSSDLGSANPQRKKKKKKKTIAADLNEIPSPHRKLGDPYLDAVDSLAKRRSFDNSLFGMPPLQAPPNYNAKH